jgi:hypothetical protein
VEEQADDRRVEPARRPSARAHREEGGAASRTVAELVAARRPVLAELVRHAVDAELVALVEAE